jgi:phospholipase/carboxylesterase
MTHRFSDHHHYRNGLRGLFGQDRSAAARLEVDIAELGASVLSPFDMPLTIFEPDYYEPNYAYPLIVWLPGLGGADREVLDLMPYISTRNYFGLSLPGITPTYNFVLTGDRRLRYGDHGTELERRLYGALETVRRHYNIRSERIVLAGYDEGATTALQLMLDRPEWFAGVIALNARFPRMQSPITRFRELRGKRVLLGVGLRDREISRSEIAATGRLLHAAGLEVSTRNYDAGYEITEEMLSDIDHWMMAGIQTAV